jgi:hypothetical protein
MFDRVIHVYSPSTTISLSFDAENVNDISGNSVHGTWPH